MSDFTPGPWEIVAYPDGQALDIEGGGCIMAHVSYDEGAWTSESESKANANLMAAAPELYEALIDIRNRIICPVGPSPTLDQIQAIASAAVARVSA